MSVCSDNGTFVRTYLVSVLDLDNTVVFEAICCKPPRKIGLATPAWLLTSIILADNLGKNEAAAKVSHLRAGTNGVVIIDLSIRCKIASDWTAKHSKVLSGQIMDNGGA